MYVLLKVYGIDTKQIWFGIRYSFQAVFCVLTQTRKVVILGSVFIQSLIGLNIYPLENKTRTQKNQRNANIGRCCIRWDHKEIAVLKYTTGELH